MRTLILLVVLAAVISVAVFADDVFWEGDKMRNIAGFEEYWLRCESGKYPATTTVKTDCGEGDSR